MSVSNVLGLMYGANPSDYKLSVTMSSGGIQGKIVCIMDKIYVTGQQRNAIWNEIIQYNGNNDSICYIVTAVVGANRYAYVGKTLNTMGTRYPNGPSGGLALVFNTYENQFNAFMECVLYNGSHPALIEGWCYQMLQDKGFTLMNVQDPS